jgi:Zn-finger nucleic acid-binding protein
MNCPRCKSKMNVFENKSVKIDVCNEGCGGIWFDWLELKKMDEAHEADPAFLEKLAKTKTKSINIADKLNCPKCVKPQPMMRKFSSVKRQVEIDECPICAGFWLDAGELTHIHSEFKTEAERRAAAEKFVGDIFGQKLESMRKESQNKADFSQKISKAFRFICPSNYIPGKQDGGAF